MTLLFRPDTLDFRPQLIVPLPDGCVQPLAKISGQPKDPDQLDYVGQVSKSARRGPRCELQLQESLEADEPDALDLDARLLRIGEGDGLGLAVPRILPGHNELDADAGVGVSKIPAALEWRHVSEAIQATVDLRQPLRGHQHVHIF